MRARSLSLTLSLVMAAVALVAALSATALLWWQYRQDIEAELLSSQAVAQLLERFMRADPVGAGTDTSSTAVDALLTPYANNPAIRHITLHKDDSGWSIKPSAASEKAEAQSDLLIAVLVIVAAVLFVGGVAVILLRFALAPIAQLSQALSDGQSTVTGRAGTPSPFLEIEQLQTAHARFMDTLAQMQRVREQLDHHKQAASQAIRHEFAQALHNDLGQALTALQFDVACLPVDGKDAPALRKAAARLEQGVTQAMLSLRGVLQFTNPDGFEDNASTAFERLLEQWRQRLHGAVQLSWELDQGLDALSADVQLALYRVLQEGVQNAVKHAHCTQLTVRGNSSESDWCLQINDNGVGGAVVPAARRGLAKGFGLALMQQRVTALGGRWELQSAAGQGTSITVRFSHTQDAS